MSPATRDRRRLAPATHQPHLRPRELEVLALVAQGRTVKECAAAMGISYFTASNHLRAVYARTGTVSQAQAIDWVNAHDPTWRERAVLSTKQDLRTSADSLTQIRR